MTSHPDHSSSDWRTFGGGPSPNRDGRWQLLHPKSRTPGRGVFGPQQGPARLRCPQSARWNRRCGRRGAPVWTPIHASPSRASDRTEPLLSRPRAARRNRSLQPVAAPPPRWAWQDQVAQTAFLLEMWKVGEARCEPYRGLRDSQVSGDYRTPTSIRPRGRFATREQQDDRPTQQRELTPLSRSFRIPGRAPTMPSICDSQPRPRNTPTASH